MAVPLYFFPSELSVSTTPCFEVIVLGSFTVLSTVFRSL